MCVLRNVLSCTQICHQMAPKYQVSMIPFYSEKAFCTSGAHTYDTVCAWWVIRACFDRRAKPLFIHSYFIIYLYVARREVTNLPNITIKIIIVLLQDIIRKHNLIFNTCSTTVATTQPKKRPRGFVILVSHVVEERPQEAEVITI